MRGKQYEDIQTLKMTCQNMPSGWDNKLSSMVVYKERDLRDLGPANGFWVGMTSTESREFTLKYGYENSHSAETSFDDQSTFDYEMRAGIEFEGESISEIYSLEIQKDVQDTYSINFGAEIDKSCTEGAVSSGVGLWQWVTSRKDSSASAFSSHTVCRYGADVYDVAPACPWNACTDGSCTTCASDWKA